MHAKHDTRVRVFSTSNHNIAGSTTITTSPQLHHMGAATIVDAPISTISRLLAHSETIDVPNMTILLELNHDFRTDLRFEKPLNRSDHLPILTHG